MADSVHVTSTTHFEEEELDSLHNNGVMGDLNEALAEDVVNDDEIVDLVGGAQDAIERHKSTLSQPEDLPEVSEKFLTEEPEPVLSLETETEPEPLLAPPTKVEEDATEQPTEEVIPDSTTVVEEPEEKVIVSEPEPEHTLIVPEPVEEIPEVPQAEPVSVIPEPIPEPVAIAPLPASVEKVLPKAPVKEAPVSAAPAPASYELLPPTAAPHPLMQFPTVEDLLYWRDAMTTGVVFGAALLLLLSLSVCSIVSVCSYVGLALLSVTIAFRIYKGILQAIQKSDEGHPFKLYLDQEVALSEDVVHKYSDAALAKINQTITTLRRVFLVEDLVDSLKFAVLMWVLTYVGALFNGLTILILGLVGAFSFPIIYEKHQVQIDHYVGMVNSQIKDAVGKIQAKVPGLKRKAE